MKLLEKMEQSSGFWFLLISSFFFFILRLPSLFEPYWYGDEGIYQVLGIAIGNGDLLYRDIWDNKPPLLYLIYALFNSDQPNIRFFSLIFGVASMIIFYFLAKNLFQNKKLIFWITGLFGFLFATPFIEGNIANAENFMLLPIIACGYLLTKSTNNRPLAGFLLSLAFLTKIVGIFDFAAFFLFLLTISAPQSLRITNIKEVKRFLIQEIKNLTPFLIGFCLPIIITTAYFLFSGAIGDFIAASFLQNVGYVGHGNKLIIPQGLLIIKLLLLFSISLILFIKRDKFSKTFIFISLWFAFSMFNAFFAGRPYTHYLLTLLPSFCLFIGLIISDKNFRKLTLAVLLICLFLIFNNFNPYGKTIYYYQNFISFVANQKSVFDYRNFFDRNTPRDYQLAQFIKMNTTENDNIFIWGNNAQVYAMSNKLPPARYAVAYHITGYEDGYALTQKGIDEKKPKLIISMPNVSDMPFSLMNYKEKVNIENIIIYERVF